jgi:hypothetical protein
MLENEPLSAADARKLIRAILDTGVVSLTKHARIEMRKDEMDEVDVFNVLRGGFVQEAEWENGGWRYRVQTNKFVVIVEFEEVDSALVITVWRLGRK